MTSPVANQIISRVEAMFANGVAWTAPSNVSATAWELPAFHLLWSDEVASESEIRRLWDDRKGRQAFSVVLLAPAENDGNVRVAGPQDARPVRELPVGRVLELLQAASSMATRQGASFLAREFIRLGHAQGFLEAARNEAENPRKHIPSYLLLKILRKGLSDIA